MKIEIVIGQVILVRYEYSSRGDYDDVSQLVRVDWVAKDGYFELSNGDHLFWNPDFGWGINWFPIWNNDFEIVPCSVS